MTILKNRRDAASMRVAVAQVSSTFSPIQNLDLVLKGINSAVERGADLVVFPEATMCAFGRPLVDVAEPPQGKWASEVTREAVAAGVTAIVGMFTTGHAGKVRNTLLVTGPSGTYRYDKIHLYDADSFRESDSIEPGSELVVFPLAGAMIGLATCFDLRFPGHFQSLAAAGAEIIVVPASWAPGPGKVHQWRTLVLARAMDSTAYVIGCGQAGNAADGGTLGVPTGVGHSLVADPRGALVSELGDSPDLLVVEINPSTVPAVRKQLPILSSPLTAPVYSVHAMEDC